MNESTTQNAIETAGTAPDMPLMLDCKQAASILSVSPRTVSRMCERGDLRAVKVMSVWRINRAALMQYAGMEG